MSTRLRIEVDLESSGLGSVAEAAAALHRAADQLLQVCGADCDFGRHCRKCWRNLTLTDSSGDAVGVASVEVDQAPREDAPLPASTRWEHPPGQGQRR